MLYQCKQIPLTLRIKSLLKTRRLLTCLSRRNLPLTHHRAYSDVTQQSVESVEDSLAWEALVDYSRLSPDEIKIHERHVEAIKNKNISYTDPRTGYMVMTRLSHLARRDCCGNSCRHCPYGQKNVPDNLKKTFNSAFYV